MTASVARALISVSDKTGLVDFARALHERGIAMLSTGGTHAALAAAGIKTTEIADYTGFPEMLGGRVKTLHPKVHGGILARRDLAEHREALVRHAIPTIDLVVVNLYPFRRTVARADVSLDQAIEQIDIGGPTLIRAAAKNWRHVGVVVDPADYDAVAGELAGNGALSDATRYSLAQKAFSHTALYDGAISNWLTSRSLDGAAVDFPERLNAQLVKAQDLRYGENPHQSAAFYRDETPAAGSISTFDQLQGKELSYNNIADADAAWECVKACASPATPCACVIVKHANPCGAAVAATPLEAYRRAFATDPVAAFGGVIAFSVAVDAPTLEAVAAQFVEVLIAPGYTADALALIAAKKNVRVLEVKWSLGDAPSGSERDVKRVGGGMLVQTADVHRAERAELRTVTRHAPTPDQLDDLLFAWRVVKFVKSNAILHAGGGATLAVGAGQMSRVDAARVAAMKAKGAGISLAGSVVASDAFFPFRDGVDVLADNGAVAVIQPGGSVRDDEVIAAADERGIAMVFTGVRHFRH